jgi:uncharacterized membrane protein
MRHWLRFTAKVAVFSTLLLYGVNLIQDTLGFWPTVSVLVIAICGQAFVWHPERDEKAPTFTIQ